jgi:uncharacterized protein YbcI
MSEPERLTGGRLNAAVADACVRVHNQYLGRGPSKAQAFFRDRVIVVVMEATLTKAERTLVESGRPDHVLTMRREFQSTMEEDLNRTVEDLTGCRVVAFMSDNHLAPDIAAELFILDRPVPGEPTGIEGQAWAEQDGRDTRVVVD